jgi:hypothetical protein
MMGFRPAQPWGNQSGFFYKERLDPDIDPSTYSAKSLPPIMKEPYTGPPVDPSRHPRYLTPRYLNLPSPNEPHLLALEQPWGPTIPGGAAMCDSIGKRWPVGL